MARLTQFGLYIGFTIITSLVLIVSSFPDHQCLCTNGVDDFVMACANSTCEWGWCGCSDAELCGPADACSGISCRCIDTDTYFHVSTHCTIDNNTLNCITCDKQSTTVIAESELIRDMPPVYVFSNMNAHVTAYRNSEIWKYGTQRSTSQGNVQRNVFSLRRVLSCLNRLLDTCANDIPDDVCLAVTVSTADIPSSSRASETPAVDTPPAQCDTDVGIMVGMFIGGFLMATLLVVIFVIFYHLRLKRAAPMSNRTDSVYHKYHIPEQFQRGGSLQSTLPHNQNTKGRYQDHSLGGGEGQPPPVVLDRPLPVPVQVTEAVTNSELCLGDGIDPDITEVKTVVDKRQDSTKSNHVYLSLEG